MAYIRDFHSRESVIPIYEYQCRSCGLQFDKLRKDPQTTAPCKCGADAKLRPSAPTFSFDHTPTGMGPQNTGASSVDHSYDRVIGQDAREKLKTVQARQDRKHQLLRDNPEADGHDLLRTDDGAVDYTVRGSTDKQRQVAAATKAVRAHVAKTVREAKQADSPGEPVSIR